MTTIKLPFLKKFCCCMELVTGVRVVTGFALVLGDFYIVMGATLYDDFYPTLVLASAVSYYISGGLYCLWFLFLLLFQTSTSSRYARTVMLVHTKVLMVWLLVVIILLALSVHALSRYKHVSVYEKEKQLIYFGILSAISVYGYWKAIFTAWKWTKLRLEPHHIFLKRVKDLNLMKTNCFNWIMNNLRNYL
ncbi:uncharacterized protein LOC128987418 isoform X2 [Macrosteles quadrilineatus]|uniref:uncharacterized protein LOC128987418 isoform X2 n=1 Tax=Macrosteles quadrilineatus TaxID=74068 RepID=UPI0023E0AA57|nr:uncharacterized protein LOC128987418 isoform X2 [Macrosteles quadrilineatus]